MTPVLIIVGFMSTYRPDTTPGELACGGRYNWRQHHIATECLENELAFLAHVLGHHEHGAVTFDRCDHR